MKLIFYIPAIILLLITGTSCSTFSEITGRDKNPSTIKTSQHGSATKTNNAHENKQRGRRNKNRINVTDNQPISDKSIDKQFSHTDSVSIAKKLTGEWMFENVAGIAITGEENRPSLTFDENTPRFYASNGCNYYNGDFTISGFHAISFNNVVSTGNICYDIPWADYITALWNVAANFYLTNRGSEEYLDIKDTKDRPLATLRRHQLSSLNGLWSIIEINGRVIDSDNPTIVIDLIEKTIHGNTGCNIFNGIIYQDPDTDRSVQFQNMAVTRKKCNNSATETALLVSLEQVEKAYLNSSDEATLTDTKGKTLIRLLRTTF